MKRILLPLLAALALPTAVEAYWFGKYGSYYEAMEACKDWRNKIIYYVTEKGNNHIIGDKYSDLYSWEKRYVEKLDPKRVSSCSHDKETNQILGLSVKGFNPLIVHNENDLFYSKKKVLKRFKY